MLRLLGLLRLPWTVHGAAASLTQACGFPGCAPSAEPSNHPAARFLAVLLPLPLVPRLPGLLLVAGALPAAAPLVLQVPQPLPLVAGPLPAVAGPLPATTPSGQRVPQVPQPLPLMAGPLPEPPVPRPMPLAGPLPAVAGALPAELPAMAAALPAPKPLPPVLEARALPAELLPTQPLPAEPLSPSRPAATLR